MNTNSPQQPHCPSCGSSNLKLNDSADHAQCQACLFHCFIEPDGSTREDRDTVVDPAKMTIDDLNAHPAFLQVFARRFAEFAGIMVSDEVIETVTNHLAEANLPKPSGATLA